MRLYFLCSHSDFHFFFFFSFWFLISLDLSHVHFASIVVDIFYFVDSFIHYSLGKMNKKRNLQQKKEPEIPLSTTDLIDMEISKMLELEFRITNIKLLAGLEKEHKR